MCLAGVSQPWAVLLKAAVSLCPGQPPIIPKPSQQNRVSADLSGDGALESHLHQTALPSKAAASDLLITFKTKKPHILTEPVLSPMKVLLAICVSVRNFWFFFYFWVITKRRKVPLVDQTAFKSYLY